jgi:hypothetical protein
MVGDHLAGPDAVAGLDAHGCQHAGDAERQRHLAAALQRAGVPDTIRPRQARRRAPPRPASGWPGVGRLGLAAAGRQQRRDQERAAAGEKRGPPHRLFQIDQ